MSKEHDFLPLATGDFHDAGDEGLALRLATEPSPETGRAFHFGCLLDAKSGKMLLEGLASALAQKFPGAVKLVDDPEQIPRQK